MPIKPGEVRAYRAVCIKGYFMNGLLYDTINMFAERKLLGSIRRELLSPLRGTVIEVGAGTGADLPYYHSDAHVLALEPDPAMMARALGRAKGSQATIDMRVADDAALELLEPQSADAIVFPLVLCTIADPLRAIDRAKRVLRRDGRLVVLEHVRGHGIVGTFQDVILPVWRRIAGGCRPNQDTAYLLRRSGFAVDRVERRHINNYSPIQDLLIGYAVVPKAG